MSTALQRIALRIWCAQPTHHTNPENAKGPSPSTATGPFDNSTNDLNFATGTRRRKAIATQIAQLALAGHVVHEGAHGDYMVCKYGLSLYCQDFDELQLFARKLGVSQ
jgi:hypothetical protein